MTFIAAMGLGMEYGILVGVGVSVGALLLKSLRPHLDLDMTYDPVTNIDYITITPENGLNFPSVDHITTTVQKLTLKQKECRLIIIDFTKWLVLDYTGANTFVLLSKGLKKNNKTLAFMNCNDAWINSFKIAGMSDPPLITGEDNISKFIQDKIKLKPDHKISENRPSLDDVVIGGYGDVEECSEAISRFSSSASAGSLASSTEPIL